ncbi:MAG: AMP-binding protein [Alistipes sp.]|nr:AMP-binding protein [Candidatus Minthomonas equi]
MALKSTTDISRFLEEWNITEIVLTVHTSGSTGTPKPILAEKSRMLSSARATCDFLGLRPGDTALLCMPLDFIAGKMMVVRSIERKLILTTVTPSNHPFSTIPDDSEGFSFAAMVPSQVYCTLQVTRERELLRKVRHLIIGGGAISSELSEALAEFPNAVWSSYGMTETLSHIALRRINGSERSEWYTPFDGIGLSLDKCDCLIIDAPSLCPHPLHTNDIAVINEDGKRFRILGRKDNVICSGGIKIQIENIEELLRPKMKTPFCISKRPDPKFGEVAVMLVENNHADNDTLESALESLPPYYRPKDIFVVDRIPLTPTGKIDRAAAMTLSY